MSTKRTDLDRGDPCSFIVIHLMMLVGPLDAVSFS